LAGLVLGNGKVSFPETFFVWKLAKRAIRGEVCFRWLEAFAFSFPLSVAGVKRKFLLSDLII